ncbi:MAG: class I SAM-dependent methyltransferase [Rhodospirillales bacterium]|nr:class I SAM-dependent methyltransferase [Rhodospirillales bacterium]
MKHSFDGFKKTGIDEEIESRLADHCAEHNISALDAVKLFPVLARRQLLKRFLAHTELFQMTLGVPGDIAELGVFRGLGLMTWANLLEAFCVGDRTKTVYGFDNWKGFTGFSPEDGKGDETINKSVGGFSPEKYLQELEDAIAIFDDDRFIPWKPRVKLIHGNIEDSVPAFVEENPGVRFSLIHFDCDLYKPTKFALQALWPVISRGGIILFDEYGIPGWPGETKAVDEFLADKPEVKLSTFDWTNAPAAYLKKP